MSSPPPPHFLTSFYTFPLFTRSLSYTLPPFLISKALLSLPNKPSRFHYIYNKYYYFNDNYYGNYKLILLKNILFVCMTL